MSRIVVILIALGVLPQPTQAASAAKKKKARSADIVGDGFIVPTPKGYKVEPWPTPVGGRIKGSFHPMRIVPARYRPVNGVTHTIGFELGPAMDGKKVADWPKALLAAHDAFLSAFEPDERKAACQRLRTEIAKHKRAKKTSYRVRVSLIQPPAPKVSKQRSILDPSPGPVAVSKRAVCTVFIAPRGDAATSNPLLTVTPMRTRKQRLVLVMSSMEASDKQADKAHDAVVRSFYLSTR